MTFGWRGSCWTWKWFDLMGLIDDSVLLRFFYIIFVRSVLTFLEVVSVSSTFQVFQWDVLQSRAKTCGQSSSWNAHLKRLVKKLSLQIKPTTFTNLNRIPYQFSCQSSSRNWSEDQKNKKHCKLDTRHPARRNVPLPGARGWTSMQKFTVSMSNKRFLHDAKTKKRQCWGSGFWVDC